MATKRRCDYMEKNFSLVLNYHCQLGSIPVPVDPGLQGCILANKHLKNFSTRFISQFYHKRTLEFCFSCNNVNNPISVVRLFGYLQLIKVLIYSQNFRLNSFLSFEILNVVLK